MGKIDRFWRWSAVVNEDGAPARELLLDGPIASESWVGDEITPKAFRAELNAEKGDVIVRINSPGGECTAGAQIYDMLREYAKGAGRVVTHIEGIAASMASVVAMAGDVVEMNPTALLMIHLPITVMIGNEDDLTAEIGVLQEFKESLMNAYQIKTGLPREEIEQMMRDETWMSSGKALELGFIDKVCDYKATPAPGKKAAARAPAVYAYSALADERERLRRTAALLDGAQAAKAAATPAVVTGGYQGFMTHHHSYLDAPGIYKEPGNGENPNAADEAARKLHMAKLTALGCTAQP